MKKPAFFLPEIPCVLPDECLTPADAAEYELRQGFAGMGIGKACRLICSGQEGEWFSLEEDAERYTVSGGRTGILYGAYALLAALSADEPLPVGVQEPRYPLRMIDCWDNMSGDVERGYAGRSLFFEGNRFEYDPARIKVLARVLAACGINVICINNVNVHEPAQRLCEDLLEETARLAALFRPFGIRLMLSIDFSRPLVHGIPTADPLDERVQAWWRERAEAVWKAIPDLAGFLVKADSENRPGPFAYGRTHAEGANMLARAVAPFGGTIVWRCFVYNCKQDWRDTKTDRGCAAYNAFKPLDGQFDGNVILQVKYGPFDFQVSEPVSPLLLSMPDTRLALEVQLAQEYTGQQIDLFAMAGLWKEIFADMGAEKIAAIAAVGNFGRDANYTGHPFAMVNTFCYGRLAWDPAQDADRLIRQWCRLSYHPEAEAEDTLVRILTGSRHAYELYTASLGLGWMVTPGAHYGPNPGGYEYQAWGTYHKAGREAVGVDRTVSGTGFTEQYPEPLRSLYSCFDTCPDRLKLFFFRLRYDTVMADGRTLLQRMYDDRFEGVRLTEEMQKMLATVPLPEPDRSEAEKRMEMQVRNAREWRDVVNTFFFRLSGTADAHGRKIYD